MLQLFATSVWSDLDKVESGCYLLRQDTGSATMFWGHIAKKNQPMAARDTDKATC